MLQHCLQLTSLQLLGCTGPFTDRLAAPAVAAAAAMPVSPALGSSSSSRAPAFRLQELQISWGAAQLTDAGLAALLHPAGAALRCLVLKGCSRLTDAAWAAVAQQAGSLQCVHLESCGALPALRKAGGAPATGAADAAGSACSTAEGQSSSSSAQPGVMTAGAAIEALAACQHLLALTVRACVAPPWAASDVDRLRTACTALQSLELA